MGFAIYTPASSRRPILIGKARVNRVGHISIHVQDMIKAGLKARSAVLLMDRDTSRIALRAERPTDHDLMEPTIPLRSCKTGRTIQFSGRGVLRELGLDPRTCNGDHPILHKDGLLIINLDGQESESVPRGKRGKK